MGMSDPFVWSQLEGHTTVKKIKNLLPIGWNRRELQDDVINILSLKQLHNLVFFTDGFYENLKNKNLTIEEFNSVADVIKSSGDELLFAKKMKSTGRKKSK